METKKKLRSTGKKTAKLLQEFLKVLEEEKKEDNGESKKPKS